MNQNLGGARANHSLLTAATKEEMAQRAKELRKDPSQRKAQHVVPDFGGVPNFSKGEVLFPHQADTLHVMHNTDRGQDIAETDGFILDVTPGGGKTRLSCADMLISLSKGLCRKPLVLMPRGLLQQQKQEMLGFTKGAPKIDDTGESVRAARKSGGPVFQLNKNTGEIRSFVLVSADSKSVHEDYLKDKNWTLLKRRVQSVEIIDDPHSGAGKRRSTKVRIPVYGVDYDQPINIVAIGSSTVTRSKGAPFDFNPETGTKRRGSQDAWTDEKVQALIEGAPPNTIFITSYSFLTQASSKASPTLDKKTNRWKDRQIVFNPSFGDKARMMKHLPGFPIDDPEASWAILRSCRPFCEWLVETEFKNSNGEFTIVGKDAKGNKVRSAPEFWDGTSDSQFARRFPQWVWLLKGMSIHLASAQYRNLPAADRKDKPDPLTDASAEFRPSTSTTEDDDNGRSRSRGQQRVNTRSKQPPFKVVQSRSAAFLDAGVDYVLLDESHKVKNEGSSITEAMKVLDDPRVKQRRIASGTIMPNQPMDILSQLKWLCPLRNSDGIVVGNKIFGPDTEFIEKYTMVGSAESDDDDDRDDDDDDSEDAAASDEPRKNTAVIWKDPVVDEVYDPQTGETHKVSAHGLKVAREKLSRPFVVRDSTGKELRDAFGKAVWTGPIGVSHRQSSWGYLMPEKEEHFHFATLTPWQQKMYDALIDCMNLDFLWEDAKFHEAMLPIVKDAYLEKDANGKVKKPKVLASPWPATKLMARMPIAEQFFVASEAIDLIDATARTVAGLIDSKVKKDAVAGSEADFDLSTIDKEPFRTVYSRIAALTAGKQPETPESARDVISTKIEVIDGIIERNLSQTALLPVLDSAGNTVLDSDGNPKMKTQTGKVIVFIGYYAGLQSIWENSRFGAKYGNSAKYSPKDDPDGLQKFKKDPAVKVLFAMQGSLREGHNLQMANCVIMTVPPHAPGDNDQLLARAYRPGQKMKVNVHHVLTEAHISGSHGPTDILKFCRMCAKMQEIAMLNSDYNKDRDREVATQSYTKFTEDNLGEFKTREHIIGGQINGEPVPFAYGVEYNVIRAFEREQFGPKLIHFGKEMYDVESDVDLSKDGFALRLPTLGEPINGDLDVFDNGPQSIDVTSTVPMVDEDGNVIMDGNRPVFWKDARADWKNAHGKQFDKRGTPTDSGSAGWASEEAIEAARQERFTVPSFNVKDYVFVTLVETPVDGQLPTVGQVVEIVPEQMLTSWLATRGKDYSAMPSKLFADGAPPVEDNDLPLLDTANGAIVLRQQHTPILEGRPVLIVKVAKGADKLNTYNVRGTYGFFDPKSPRISFPKAERALTPGTFVQLIDRDPDSISKDNSFCPQIVYNGMTRDLSTGRNVMSTTSMVKWTTKADPYYPYRRDASYAPHVFEALLDVDDWVVMPRSGQAQSARDAQPYGEIGDKYKPNLLTERYTIKRYFSRDEYAALTGKAIAAKSFQSWGGRSDVQNVTGVDHHQQDSHGGNVTSSLFKRLYGVTDKVVDPAKKEGEEPESAICIEMLVSRCHIRVTQRPTSAFNLAKYGKKDLYDQVDKEVETFSGVEYINTRKYVARVYDSTTYNMVEKGLQFSEDMQRIIATRAHEVATGKFVIQPVVSVKNVFDVKSIDHGRLAGYVPPAMKPYNTEAAAVAYRSASLKLAGFVYKGKITMTCSAHLELQQGDPMSIIARHLTGAPKKPPTKEPSAVDQVDVWLSTLSKVFITDDRGETKSRNVIEYWDVKIGRGESTGVAKHVGYVFSADFDGLGEDRAAQIAEELKAGENPFRDPQAWMSFAVKR